MANSAQESVRILVVEDNPADVYLLKEALRETPLTGEILVCSDGEDALKRLRGEGQYANAAPPELLLLDLNLPRVDGRGILDAMRDHEKLRDLCVILLSSSPSPRDRSRISHLARGLFLEKPTDLDGYQRLGERIYDFWRDCAKTA